MESVFGHGAITSSKGILESAAAFPGDLRYGLFRASGSDAPSLALWLRGTAA
ncbi:hypothetical protein ACWGQ4_00140 [Streptomyces sp. NPDC055721]|uniref:hypothetical protein n=1 Tax=Streptomyces sp. NPDC127132 TaxID=3345374 RepID=UPI003645B64F